VSDLQCAATFVFVASGEETRVDALVADLRFRRVAMVYAGAGAKRTARVMADHLGVQVSSKPGLDERAVLEGIADEHRGETLLVVADAAPLATVLPTLVPGLPASYRHGLIAGDVVEMRVDADGWVVDSWAREDGSAGRP
jgi:hypothetical protein